MKSNKRCQKQLRTETNMSYTLHELFVTVTLPISC